MAIHDADSVDVYSIHALEEVKKEVNNDYLAVQQAINNLLLSHSQELGQVKVEYYKAEKLKNRANLRDYVWRVDQQAILVRRSTSQIQNASDLGQSFERKESGKHKETPSQRETPNQTEAGKSAAVDKLESEADFTDFVGKNSRELATFPKLRNVLNSDSSLKPIM